MKTCMIVALFSSALTLGATGAIAQNAGPDKNNEFNTCASGSMDPRCYVAQGREERNNEFNTCAQGNVDPRCFTASGGGRIGTESDGK